MASVRELARAHQDHQRRISAGVTREATRLWRRVARGDIAGSWRLLSPRLFALLSAAQVAAARQSDGYAATVLAAQGVDDPPVGLLLPEAFAGITSTGGNLVAALAEPVIAAKLGLAQGWGIDRAMGYGLAVLTRTVDTQVTDAGRAADSVATATRRRVRWYVRMVSPGACSRCIILAGRRYAWNDGFLRHPHCHCRHIPLAEDADDYRTDPRAYFDRLSADEQDQTFGKAGAQAVRDGADLAQVVNARAGMDTIAGPTGRRRQTTRKVAGRDVFATKTGTSRRGTSPGFRLMPEQIYREAGADRDEAVRLLRRYGYIL